MATIINHDDAGEIGSSILEWKTMELSAYQTNPSTESLAILQRIRRRDKTAVNDCIENLFSEKPSYSLIKFWK